MTNENFVDCIVENKDEIEKVLGIDELKKENEMLKRMLETIFEPLMRDDGKLEKLEEKQRKLKRKNEMLKERVALLESENSRLKTEMEEVKADLKKLTEENKKPEKLKRVYDSLDAQVKKRIGTVLKPEDRLSLLVSGVLNIEKIWEYAAYLRREHRDSEFEKLKEIFHMLFEEYEKVKNVSLQKVEKGARFDTEIFTRDNRSEAVSGIVEEVVLRGFLENGKIVEKSIVRVK